MAFLTDGTFLVTMTVVDQGNQSSTLSFITNLTNVTDFAGAVTAANNLRPDLEGVVTGNVRQFRISQVYLNDSFVLPADAQNQDKASVSFNNTDGSNGNLKIPSPVSDIFVAPVGVGNNVVDITDGLLTAYTDNFRSTGEFVIDGGRSLNQLTGGKRIHAKSNFG